MDGDSIMQTFTHKGIELYLSDSIISNAFRQTIRKNNDYEIQEYEMIQKYLPKNNNIIELGGGIGFTSCVISKHTSDDITHIVVEPTFELLSVIEENMFLNQCAFKIIHAAYGPPKKSVTLYKKKEAYENSTVNFKDKDEIIINEEQVRSIQLSPLLNSHLIDTFSLVCDIEGQEEILTRFEMNLLEEYCNVIIIEIHEPVKQNVVQRFTESDFMLQERRDNVYVYS